MILSRLKEKLALIPDGPKLVVFPMPENVMTFKSIPEVLVVQHGPAYRNEDFQETLQEVFRKRLQTLDLVAMMYEVQRTFPLKTFSSLHYRRPISSICHDFSRNINNTIIDDRLSSLPRLQKTEENSKTWWNPNWPTCPFKPFQNFPIGLCWINFFSVPLLSLAENKLEEKKLSSWRTAREGNTRKKRGKKK